MPHKDIERARAYSREHYRASHPNWQERRKVASKFCSKCSKPKTHKYRLCGPCRYRARMAIPGEIEKLREQRTRWYNANPENRAKAKKSNRAYRIANRDMSVFRTALSKHSLTLDQYHARYESQDFGCAICGNVTKLMIDHNHDTERRRGLLCRRCNTALPFIENVAVHDKATAYLQKWA